MNIQQFQYDRFGLFLHWGVYAIPARGEWVRNYDEMKEEDYIPFVKEFNPAAFDPHAWAICCDDCQTPRWLLPV